MAPKMKTIFVCSVCGNESIKWYGQCPNCRSWNTMEERAILPESPPTGSTGDALLRASAAVPLSSIEETGDLRIGTGSAELDRVLGGGTVRGSMILVGGEPGIGKSTLLLQVCAALSSKEKVLYVTGEESAQQIKLRAARLGVASDNLYVQAETRMDIIVDQLVNLRPRFVVVDSVQTIYRAECASAPGSTTQIRESAQLLMHYAKAENATVFMVGHVNKEGTLAGPKILEHMVDCVLYFEGDRHASYRIIRAVKNRYGSTNEIGVFEMTGKGLQDVPNPSEALLSGRPKNVPGSCVACVMEGSRPLLAEVQALVSKSSYGNARRTADGFDYNRAVLLLAVLEKRVGINVGACDAYLNVTGGMELNEPAADLPALLAVVSSIREKALPERMAAFGEVGLTGELRAVSSAQSRIAEIARLGFTSCILPSRCCEGLEIPKGVTLCPADDLMEAIRYAHIR